jgi:hypothetical protein
MPKRALSVATHGAHIGPHQVMYGIEGFATDSYYRTAANEGIAGSATFSAAWLMMSKLAVFSATTYPFTRGTAVQNWTGFTVGTVAQVKGRLRDGADANQDTPQADYEQWYVHSFACTYGSDVWRMYLDGVEQGSGTAATGFTATANTRTSLGAHHTGLGPYEDGPIFGAMGVDGTEWSAAEILTMHKACMAAGDIVAVPAKTDHLWSVRQSRGSVASGSTIATLTDEIGSDNLDLTGAGGTAVLGTYKARWRA